MMPRSSTALAATGALLIALGAVPTARSFHAQRPPQRIPTRRNGLADLTTGISDAYAFALQNYQLPTQSATAGILCGVGDVVAQVSDDESDGTLSESDSSSTHSQAALGDLDRDRSFRFVLKGLGGGVIWSQWYAINDQWSDSLVQSILQQQTLSADAPDGGVLMLLMSPWILKTLLSVALEQFVACPLIYALWDIPVPAILEGETSLENLSGGVRRKLPGLLIENAKVWTIVNMIVYNVPIQFRVMFMSLCDVFWQSVISKTVSESDTTRVVDTRILDEPLQ